MPVTLPAHPAAILPLRRHLPALPLCALVVGSLTPDLAYPLGIYGGLSHSFSGLVTFCLPVGLGFYLWAQWLLLPLLRRTLPTVRGVELARFAVIEGTSRSLSGWLWTAAAVVLGAITHVLWDGITHTQRWPALVLLAPLASRDRFLLCNILQIGFSVLGTLIVVRAMIEAYPRLPPVNAPPQPLLFWAWFTPMSAAFGAAFAWRAAHLVRVQHATVGLWFMFWTGVGAALAVLTASALVVRWVPGRELEAGPPEQKAA